MELLKAVQAVELAEANKQAATENLAQVFHSRSFCEGGNIRTDVVCGEVKFYITVKDEFCDEEIRLNYKQLTALSKVISEL